LCCLEKENYTTVEFKIISQLEIINNLKKIGTKHRSVLAKSFKQNKGYQSLD